MKRLLRIIFGAMTCLSLLLCAVTVVLWSRSYTQLDSHSRLLGRNMAIWVGSWKGKFGMIHQSQLNTAGENDPDSDVYLPNTNHFGFGITRGTGEAVGDGPTVTVSFESTVLPDAAVFIVTAILPVFALLKITLRRKTLLDHCATCGYDLRATPDRCPVCGALPVEKASNR